MKIFSNDLGVDLGTSNVRIYVDKKGIVVNEPAVVAMDSNTGRILQVGDEARNMLGRTPGNLVAMYPLKNGVISDHAMAVRMMQVLFRRAAPKGLFSSKPRVVICVSSGITEVESRTVVNAAIEAGARRVYLIEEPLAAAMGANLEISGPKGHMVVDIGGGTTDIAVLALNGVAASSSLKLAGDSFDDAIVRYIRRNRSLIIGKTTAEEIKIHIGTVDEHAEETKMLVSGRDLRSGNPQRIELTSTEICEVLRRPAMQIIEAIRSVLEDASPELVSDVLETGITLTGGGCQLGGLAYYIQKRTGVPCRLADDPDSCVVYGCGKSLNWINHMKEGPVNYEKKRAMR